MSTLKSLNLLQQTSSSLLSTPIPVALSQPPIQYQMRFLTELTFIHVLKLLGVEDEAKLAEIISHLRKGSLFYDFTNLAHNLAKSKTDFEFLTSPENLPIYKKIAEVSDECDVELLPYVNVLSKIADNKQYGMYSDNQEVVFFLEEYGKNKDKVDAKEFLHQFKKILKYQTQRIFEQFITDNIFSIIQQTLNDYKSEIINTPMLAIYVYGINYYQGLISNENENTLLEHIKFCISYMASHNEINYEPAPPKKYFPEFYTHQQAVDHFFEHNNYVLQSPDRFIGLLKDYCPIDEIYDFSSYLRRNLYAINPILFDEKKSKFNSFMARKIREKASSKGNYKLYKDIYALLPLIYQCERSPSVLDHGGDPLLIFNKPHGDFLFYASEKGNTSPTLPKAHDVVEVEILEKNSSGYAIKWRWTEIKSVT